MDFDELEKNSNNPSRVINTIFNEIESSITNGGGTIDATGHPFAYAVDLIVGTSYAFISRLGDGIAQNHLVHARTIADLSKQMSDDDWTGVYAEPSSCTFRVIISQETIDNNAIRFEDTDGALNNSYKKIVLPPDTRFTVAGIPFLLENPVEIRKMDHGGYQVVYDSSRVSQFKPLETNTPTTKFLDIDSRRYIAIELPVRQLSIQEDSNNSVNYATGFSKTITFSDGLYAVRAFITPDGSSTRNEMAVVFNNDIFDTGQPTLTVDMLTDNSFQASIPSVYIQNGTAVGRLTILVYTTKGYYYSDLTTLKSQDRTIDYYNYNNEKGKLDTYEKPFATINDVTIDNSTPITGGRNAMEFSELKNLMIYGHRKRSIPISPADLSQFLLYNGYSSVKALDTGTKRLYRVTKTLPLQDDKLGSDESYISFNSSIGTFVGEIITSLEELVGSGNAIDNGDRITIPHHTVFDITSQTPYVVNSADTSKLMSLSGSGKVDAVANKTLVFNPFTYVIDVTKNRASVRTYRFTDPTIKYQTFRYENANLGVQVGVGAIAISYGSDGYTITIQTTSSDAYKAIDDTLLNIQLSFTAADSNAVATMKGKFLGSLESGERVFQFTLPTQFDIDEENQIDLKGFNQFGKLADEVRVPLITTANFIFTYSGEGYTVQSSSDLKIDQNLFEKLTVSMIETEYVITFGSTLNSLYSRIRPLAGLAQYKKYEASVPSTYTENVYLYEDGQLVLDSETGLPTLVHKRGDVIVNEDGSTQWSAIKGQTVYDEDGNPVELESRKMKYYLDFIGFDFSYLLSQDEYDTAYLTKVKDFFIDEVDGQLTTFNNATLDETKLLYKPKSTMGYTNVTMNEGVESTIKNDISFVVIYFLTKEGNKNQNLKTNLRTLTQKTINTILSNTTISVSDIVTSLRTSGGTDVLDVLVTATAGDVDIDVVSNMDETNGFSVKKVIEQTSDNYLTIKQDIDIQFKVHKN